MAWHLKASSAEASCSAACLECPSRENGDAEVVPIKDLEEGTGPADRCSTAISSSLSYARQKGAAALDRSAQPRAEETVSLPRKNWVFWKSVQGHKDAVSPARECREPLIEFFPSRTILPMLSTLFDEMTSTFEAMQYVMDHTDLCLKLALKVGKGVRRRIIFDRENFFNSSCARQSGRVCDLYHEGVQMRVIKPTGSGFASMHAKSWIVDGRVLVTGSCNLSHGGLEHNIEQVVRITDPTVVNAALEEYENVWQNAQEVTRTDINHMVAVRTRRNEETEKKKEQGAQERRERSQSRSRSCTDLARVPE